MPRPAGSGTLAAELLLLLSLLLSLSWQKPMWLGLQGQGVEQSGAWWRQEGRQVAAAAAAAAVVTGDGERLRPQWRRWRLQAQHQ